MAYGTILGQTPTASSVSYNNASTSSIITGTNVQQAIDQLFQSVSNGKSLIASAITDMGVSTSASDSFGTMADNIREIVSGSGPFSEIILLTQYTPSVSSGSISPTVMNIQSYMNQQRIVAKDGDCSFAWPASYKFFEDGNDYRLNGAVCYTTQQGTYWGGSFRNEVNSYTYPWCPLISSIRGGYTYNIYYCVAAESL